MPTSPKPSTIRIGKRYRSSRIADDYDAIVIGSGMGGLSTAALLSKAGQKVLVLEQHYTAGGYTHSYSRNGYEWDVGVHYIGDLGRRSSPIRMMFDTITDGELKWAKMDEVYDRFYFGDEIFELRVGRRNFIEDLCGYFPGERKAIERYMVLLDRVGQLLPLHMADKFVPETATSWFNRVKKSVLPDYLNRTTYEVLRELTDNEKLISVLTGQMGDCGLPPKQSSFIIHALIAAHYLNGGYYPVGGASRIAETVIPVVQASGGDVMTYADVKEIVIEKGRAVGVKIADGHVIRAPKIISNAGVINTFEHLVPKPTASKHGYLERLKGVESSLAHLGMYIGLKGSPDSLGLPKTNYWLYPSFDPEADFQRFFEDRDVEFPLTYISFPSAKDSSWSQRYPNKSTIEMVTPCPYEWFAQWKDEPWGKRGDDYEALKHYFSERLLEQLYEKLPQLRGKVDYYELSTPLSTDFFCAYKKGELYGLNHDPKRFSQAWLKPKTTIPGLYLTGQDILSCGVASALMSGLMTTVSVLGWKSYKLLSSSLKGSFDISLIRPALLRKN